MTAELGLEIQRVRQNIEIEARGRVKKVGKVLRDGFVDRLEKWGVIDWFGNQVIERFPRVTSVRWATPEVQAKFLQLTEQGLVPEMFSAHFIHIDANFMAEGFSWLQRQAREHGLEENLTGAAITVAGSVSNGKQDRFMQAMFSYMKEHARRNNVEFFEVTRKKDKNDFDMEKVSLEPFRQRLGQRGTAAIVFPYGSIQAGRHIAGTPIGVIDGMKELIESDGSPKKGLFEVFGIMDREGRKINQRPYLLPVAISRSYLAQNPDSYWPTPEALGSLYDWPSHILRFVGFRRLVVEITMLEPITKEDLRARFGTSWNTNKAEANKFLMEQVARYQLPSERGQYSYVTIESDGQS